MPRLWQTLAVVRWVERGGECAVAVLRRMQNEQAPCRKDCRGPVLGNLGSWDPGHIRRRADVAAVA